MSDCKEVNFLADTLKELQKTVNELVDQVNKRKNETRTKE